MQLRITSKNAIFSTTYIPVLFVVVLTKLLTGPTPALLNALILRLYMLYSSRLLICVR